MTCNLKTTKLLDWALVGVCAVSGSHLNEDFKKYKQRQKLNAKHSDNADKTFQDYYLDLWSAAATR